MPRLNSYIGNFVKEKGKNYTNYDQNMFKVKDKEIAHLF